MITSDINSTQNRPARMQINDPYRTLPREVVAAAVRSGVPLVTQTVSGALDSSYEFPGDLTNNRTYRQNGMI